MSKIVGEYAVHGVLDEHGTPHSFLPGSEPPAWAVKQMGAHCFTGGEDVFNEDGVLAPVVHHDAVVPDVPVASGPPPQAGPGSAKDKWVAYAEANGVDPEGLDKAEIIAELENAGVPVE